MGVIINNCLGKLSNPSFINHVDFSADLEQLQDKMESKTNLLDSELKKDSDNIIQPKSILSNKSQGQPVHAVLKKSQRFDKKDLSFKQDHLNLNKLSQLEQDKKKSNVKVRCSLNVVYDIESVKSEKHLKRERDELELQEADPIEFPEWEEDDVKELNDSIK